MKIVIDISEDVYTRLFDNGIQDNEIAVDDVCEMARAIRLGTPQKKPEKLLPCTCGSNRRYLWMNTIPGEPTWFYTCGGNWEYEQAVGHRSSTSYIYVCKKCGKRIEIDEVEK